MTRIRFFAPEAAGGGSAVMRSLILGLSLILTLPLAAQGQDLGRQVRFWSDSAGGSRVEGRLEQLSAESLYVRLRGTDSVAAYSRKAIGAVERKRQLSPGRAVGVGCVVTGGALGAAALLGSSNSDTPVLVSIVSTLAFGVGCVAGGFGGLAVAQVVPLMWEEWPLPDAIPASVPPADR